MSHDTHFLERLSRVTPQQTDLALSLYRDPGLVKELLARAHLPEGAERVAIELDPTPDGPHLVVARDGHFVTCLGAGMSTQQLPIITRAKLDSVAAQLAKLRENLGIAESLGGTGRDADSALLLRLMDEGPWVSRETWLGLEGLFPMAAGNYYDCYLRCRSLVTRARAVLGQLRPPHRETAAADLARFFWTQVHLLPFVLRLETVVPEGTDLPDLATLLREVVRLDAKAALPFAGFGIAALGKACLPRVKEFLADDAKNSQFVGILASCALASSHPKLLPELRKALERKLENGKRLVRLVEDVEEADQLVLEEGRGLLAKVEWGRKPEPAWREDGEIPPQVARAAALGDCAAFVGSGSSEYGALRATLALARFRPEEVLFPASVVRQLDWDLVAEGEDIARVWREQNTPEPVKVEQRPGRNEPCSCGSGKKFKRCCGG